jgi:vancomycin resistance protein YoaR
MQIKEFSKKIIFLSVSLTVSLNASVMNTQFDEEAFEKKWEKIQELNKSKEVVDPLMKIDSTINLERKNYDLEVQQSKRFDIEVTSAEIDNLITDLNVKIKNAKMKMELDNFIPSKDGYKINNISYKKISVSDLEKVSATLSVLKTEVRETLGNLDSIKKLKSIEKNALNNQKLQQLILSLNNKASITGMQNNSLYSAMNGTSVVDKQIYVKKGDTFYGLIVLEVLDDGVRVGII